MASAKQLAANRLNALKARGPVTAEGKARSSQNALKHGLSGRHDLLPHEDPAAYQALRDALLEELRPQGVQEHLLVRQMLSAAWRLERAWKLETHCFAWLQARGAYRATQAGTPKVDSLAPESLIARDLVADKGMQAIASLHRYITALERSYHRAAHELDLAQAARHNLQNEPNSSQRPAPDSPLVDSDLENEPDSSELPAPGSCLPTPSFTERTQSADPESVAAWPGFSQLEPETQTLLLHMEAELKEMEEEQRQLKKLFPLNPKAA